VAVEQPQHFIFVLRRPFSRRCGRMSHERDSYRLFRWSHTSTAPVLGGGVTVIDRTIESRLEHVPEAGRPESKTVVQKRLTSGACRRTTICACSVRGTAPTVPWGHARITASTETRLRGV